MKRTLVVICIYLSIIATMAAQNSKNNFEKEWEKVTKYADDDLPGSAVDEIDKILKKAIADKNAPQVIKSLLSKSTFEVMIDDNNKVEIFAELQKLLVQTNNEAEKALLHSLLAQLYIDYFQNNSWEISSRTDLADVVPDDIEEWTVSTFSNAVEEHLKYSVRNVDALKQATTQEYKDIIILGEDSRTYYPTLYDFLMKRALELTENMPANTKMRESLGGVEFTAEKLAVPADEFVKLDVKDNLILQYYQQYFKDLLSRNMTSTIVLTELGKVRYLESVSYSFRQNKSLDFLKQLEAKYRSNETNAAVIMDIIKALSGKAYTDSDLADSGLTEAYDWCTTALDRYPNYRLIDNIKNAKKSLDQPQLQLSGKNVYYTDREVKIDILHKNLQQLSNRPALELYKVEAGKDNLSVNKYPLTNTSRKSYLAENDELSIGKLAPGDYQLKSSKIDEGNNNEIMHSFTVSRLASYSRNSSKGSYDIYVVDRVSGRPIKGATVTIRQRVKSESVVLTTRKTNDSGLALFKDIKELNSPNYFNGYYTIEYENDIYPEVSINEDYSFRYENDVAEEEYGNISVFTDRSIYRPGQIVYFKSVIVDKNRKPANKTKVTVDLKNIHGESVAKKELTTNEFGSIAGEFILPKIGLMGMHSIEVESNGEQNSHMVNVEEYKRPTFEITFDKIEKTYAFDEEVTVKGFAKNFSGINLQDATVKYTIVGRQFSFWRHMGKETSSEAGEVVTKDDGSFEITFTPRAGDSRPTPVYRGNNILQFTVNAEVTDLNGETQNGVFSLCVGDVSMAINIDILDKIEKSDKSKISIKAMNLNGVDIDAEGSYTVFSLNEKDSIANKVSGGSFKVGDQPQLRTSLNKLSSGKYRIKLLAKDSNGKDVEHERDFLLYSYNDKMPPIKTNEWLVEKNTTIAPGKNAEILFGVSDKDVNVLYQLYNDTKVFENKRIIFNKENKMFTIPYKAEYGDQIYLTLTYVKDEKFYNQSILIKKEVEKLDAKLEVKLEVFRDKLRPGQDETWTISVKNTKGDAIDAELLASMYDMSLDKLVQSSGWYLNMPYVAQKWIRSYNYNTTISNYYPRNYNGRNYWWFSNRLGQEDFQFDQFNLFGFGFSSKHLVQMKTQRSVVTASPAPPALRSSVDYKMADGIDSELSEMVVVRETSSQADFALAGGMANEADEMPESGTPQIRTNFNETAFFYPQLRTNANGETLISFTVPESNTQWKFRALAYDKDLKVGQLEQLVISRKELMVTPNMPRFVRQGDETSISTKISNLSENAIAGKVYLEFFDPLTDKTINLEIKNKEQAFSLEKDASSSVEWTFDIPGNIDLLGCRIVASNDMFSDGEQHVLPVLSNRMLVTESMPFDVTEEGESTFTYDKLKENKSSTLQNYRLTFEYTSNPAWYAVQALPVLSNPTSDNVINWFAAYYVNTLGASIMKQYPQVGQMIEAWKKQGGDKETLVSKLQKNEELKNVLLTETPWVLEAKSETEQMERLTLLFDLNNTKQQTEQATQKLAGLQDNIGGWSWYKGMYPSRSMTQYLLYGYAKLQLVGHVEYSSQIKEMQIKALGFIDAEIVKNYESLKTNNKDWKNIKAVSTNQLEYLYVRTFYRDIPISQEAREAERFYTSVATGNWKSLSLYERSLLVTLLVKNGEKELAGKIVKTIKERSVTDKNLGMYWPNNKNNNFLPKKAIAEHVFLMNALQEVGATTKEVDQMKQWLVKQKQTQVWESVPATINAINALLSTGSDWFARERSNTNIKVGSNIVKTNEAEHGTGYVKTTWNQTEINNNMSEIHITKDGNQPSYGALYWQYYEDLNKITMHKNGLNVDKQLFRTEKSAAGRDNLVSISAETPLKVGDKVTVRLAVRVDNDVDFVQIKDMRAPCFEPMETISRTKWMNSTVYYQETRDASTNLYFDNLKKGTYVFEYQVYVNRTGTYSNGITTIQSMYAPELVSHTQGITVTVK